MMHIKIKKTLFILFLSSLVGCHFNATRTNEKSVKEKGEQVANKLYDYISEQNYDKTIQPFLSKKFRKEVGLKRLDSTLSKIHKDVGDYKTRILVDWSTERRVGTNNIWKCILYYSVTYQKGQTNEIVFLTKEQDSIKIASYKIKGNK